MKLNHFFLVGYLFISFLFSGCGTVDVNQSQESESVFLDGSSASRRIHFSGFNWAVKESENLAGPGPNWWSASEENVWVDKQGRLHLMITYRDGKWYCAEIVCEEPAVYGTYEFHFNGPIDDLDPRVILGLFTWDDTAYKTQANCEIDIEFSRWNDPFAPNLHYSVQPARGPESPDGRYKERYHSSLMELEDPRSSHIFKWTPDRVEYSSFEGGLKPANLLDSWSYNSTDHPARRTEQGGELSDPIGIPKPGPDTHIRINLWLLDADGDGVADQPRDGEDVEVIIERFDYTPL